ncbi:antitoxin VapB family protein [Natrarchaeobaculum aegyptiacum]|uniref:Antitoxin n=1 Tax=Natrarchaeobaculum aegyptiacum TaxID=745377 RepID=A0A2Z2HQ78_9EURY|nr:antitoxin VapB family protein [Natrarchaeobaculum aegyptiacum]ARS89280.1 hypothetical protein B1756_05650 [Natrarchaeobaculum aegyptiacum]
MESIDLEDDVYERLRRSKRNDETVSDVVDRLCDESSRDWRDGFGTLSESDAAELERIVTGLRDGRPEN